MLAHVEVIGPGSFDSSSSVQIFFSDARYLFECGDGTQRLCTEYGIRLSKLRGIYLTSVTAPSVGGLFGLLLTVADIGKEKLSIVAPNGIRQLFRSARYFYNRPSLSNTIVEVDMRKNKPSLITDDKMMTVEAVPISARRDMEIDTDFGMHCDAVSYVCRLRDLKGKFDPVKAAQLGVKKGRMYGLLQKGLTITLDDGTQVRSDQVMAPGTPGPVVLIIACPSVHHIDSLAMASGLKPSNLDLIPNIAKPDAETLKKKSEENDNKGSNGVAANSAVTTTTPETNGNAAEQKKKPRRQCVICHLAPRKVLMHPKYRQWSDDFGLDVSHIAMHSTVARKQAVLMSHAEDMAMLHDAVDKEIFPLPQDCVFPPGSPIPSSEARQAVEEKKALGISLETQTTKDETAPIVSTVAAGDGDKNVDDDGWSIFKGWRGVWHGSQSKLRFILSPATNIGFDQSIVPPRYVTRKPEIPLRPWRDVVPEYATEPSPSGTEHPTPRCMRGLAPRTAAVRFLGTGAAIPGKRRNVSSTLLDLFERGSVLLDCGEGTWGQLVRLYGHDKAQRVVCMMKVIFISHMHADHHLGLMSLLHQRAIAMNEHAELRNGPQLIIVGPTPLHTWLEGFQQAAHVPLLDQTPQKKRPFRFFNAASLTDPQTADAKFFPDAFGLELGCVSVIHCPLSFALVISDCINGWKVVFSGDTRPCQALAEAGKNATLAIHEATLEDELSEEALEKKHSTTGEALNICARDMNAWRTILTHFSQRYPKIPRLDAKILKDLYGGRAAVACDLMSVDFARLEEIPRIVPAVRECYPDEYEQWTTPVSNEGAGDTVVSS